MMAIRIATFLPCFVLGEEPLAAGKAIWLEEEAKDEAPHLRLECTPGEISRLFYLKNYNIDDFDKQISIKNN